jgi:hypothetical protein
MDDEAILSNEAAASKLLANRIRDGARYMMGNRSGRALMWYLLEQYGVFQEGFSSDALILARTSGRRSAGLQLMQLIDTFTPEKYQKMVDEAREDAIITNPMGEE